MRRDPAVLLVTLLSAVLAIGCVVMAVAHAGIEVPVLSRFGPEGNGVVAPAVIVFTAGALVLAAIAYGTSRGRAWAWAGGIVVHGLVVLGSITPYRGVGSLVAIVIAGTVVITLLTRRARNALLPTA